MTKVPLPAGIITGLPTTEHVLAWTVDDGSNSEVIRLYTEFARTSGTRLTSFLNGFYPGWTEHAALLRPLVDSGQIQVANHTWSHADLTSLSDADIAAELQRNHDFIASTFGVDSHPPYGYRDARTDPVAASIGYTAPHDVVRLPRRFRSALLNSKSSTTPQHGSYRTLNDIFTPERPHPSLEGGRK